MLIEVSTNKNLAIITVPITELEKFGLSVGDEIEVSRNKDNEIVLRAKQNERTKRILDATREIIENRKSALLELGKGHE